MKNNGSGNHIAVKSTNQETVEYAEHRTSHRHQFSALAEVIEPRTRTRLTCRATDLSLGGSYVDTISPFAVGTTVLVRLSCEGRSFQTGARVTYALNGMGMGLAFTPEMPVEQAAALHSWIAELSGDFQAAPTMTFESAPPATRAAEPSSASEDTASLREGTRELVQMLLHKQVLTEPEASALRSKLVR